MESSIKSRNNFFTGGREIEYRLQLPVPQDRKFYQKFAWHLLHTVLPREIRSGGVTTNIKGISSNNVLREDLPRIEGDNESLLYHLGGTALVELDGEQDAGAREESFYTIKSDFHLFPDRRNIQYKSNVFFEGAIGTFLQHPVYEFKPDLEIKELILGLEFFEANLFWLIGLAPRITKVLIIQASENNINFRFKLEQSKLGRQFFEQFGEIGKKLKAYIFEACHFDITSDFDSKTIEK